MWKTNVIKLLYFVAISSLIGCETYNRVPIENFDTETFSEIYYENNPELPHFSNFESLPNEITTGDYLDHNSILFLTESTNVPFIEKDNLQKILPKKEYEDWLQNYCIQRNDSLICQKKYYGYGRIIKKRFTLLELNIRNIGEWGRNYSFEIRTHKHSGELISKIEFAKWSDKDDDYFSGILTPAFEILIFQGESILKTYKIMDSGEIIEK